MSLVGEVETTMEQDSKEMKRISVRRQELESRLSFLQEMQDFLKNRNASESVSEEEEQGLSELEKVKRELQMLSERESEFSTKNGSVTETSSGYNYITADNRNRVCVLPTIQQSATTANSEEVVEVTNLSLSPAIVHCPACLQRVTTETHRKVGSTTFLLCFLSVLMCCVGGCCLIPFCMNYFKDVCHTCPSCHAEIRTIPRI